MLADVEAPGACCDLLEFSAGRRFRTIMADPPWRFQNASGKIAPEHRRLHRYRTMELAQIMELPVAGLSAETAHLYLWVPNALLPEGIAVLRAWGFAYKSNIVWRKIRRDGEVDGRGVGFYFRNVTELILFGVRGKNARTLAPGRSQVNIIHLVSESTAESPTNNMRSSRRVAQGPYLELFSRGCRKQLVNIGEIRQTKAIPPLGRRTGITRQPKEI